MRKAHDDAQFDAMTRFLVEAVQTVADRDRGLQALVQTNAAATEVSLLCTNAAGFDVMAFANDSKLQAITIGAIHDQTLP